MATLHSTQGKRGGYAQLVCPEFKQCLRVYLINQVAASSVVLDVGVEDKPRKKAPKVGEVQFVPIFDYHDASTKVLMTEFYRQMQQTPDKAAALRQAMLVTMKKYSDPEKWSAFTLIGESRN